MYDSGYRSLGSLAAILAANPPITSQKIPQRRSQSYTKVMRKKNRNSSKGGNSFGAAVRKLQPAKHLTAIAGAALLQNQIQGFAPTSKIVQGTDNNDRIGDSVFLEALKINYNVETNTTAGAYVFRVIVGYSGEEYGAATFSTTTLTSAELFLPTTGTEYWKTNACINPKAFTVLYDQTIDANSQIAATRDVQSMSVTIPLKSRFPYQTDASGYGKFKNLYIIVLGSVSGGTDNTTSVGNMTCTYDLIFKD